jgi:hypothetical protein
MQELKKNPTVQQCLQNLQSYTSQGSPVGTVSGLWSGQPRNHVLNLLHQPNAQYKIYTNININ